MNHFPDSFNHGIEKKFSNSRQQLHHMLYQGHYKLQYMPNLFDPDMYNSRLRDSSSTDPMIALALVLLTGAFLLYYL